MLTSQNVNITAARDLHTKRLYLEEPTDQFVAENEVSILCRGQKSCTKYKNHI